MQLRLRADRVDGPGLDDRARPRAVVVAVPIFEIRGVAELPIGRPRLRVQAFDDLLVAQPMQEHEPLTRDRRRSVAGALGERPDQGRRQSATELRLGRYRVVRRPEKGSPVVRGGVLGQRFCLRDDVGLRTGERGGQCVHRQSLQHRAPRHERHGQHRTSV